MKVDPRVDPFNAVAQLPGIAEAADAGRRSIDELLWERSLRDKGAQLAQESMLRGAAASAALDGVDIRLAAWRSGDAIDDSPMGRAAAGYLRLVRDTTDLARVMAVSPSQVWARMHALVALEAGDESAPESLGRLRSTENADDPMRIGSLPALELVAPRIDLLSRLIAGPSEAPALVVSAIAHGELLGLRPFEYGSGAIARATVRVLLKQRGVDPDGLSMPEEGIRSLGRPAYVDAIRGYLSGEPDGMARWVRFHCEAVGRGATLAREVLAQI